MNGGFQKFKLRMSDALGTSVLSKQFMGFALVHTFFLIFANPYGIFINTLLYRVTGDNRAILLYNVTFYFFFALSMPLAGLYMRKTSPLISARTGIALHILLYAAFFVLLFTNRLREGMVLLAAIAAIASTTYWIAFNVLLMMLTSRRSRDVGLALLGMSAGAVALIMPTFSGNVIARFEGMTGYVIMFGLAMFLSVVTIVLSTKKLPPVEATTRKTRYKLAIYDVIHDHLWRLCMCTEFIRGLREGTFAFFLNVLLFEIVRNEAIVGINTLLVGVLAVLANWTIGRFLKMEKRVTWMFWAVNVLFVTCGLLFFSLNAVTIMMMSAVNAYFNVILLNPMATINFTMYSRNERSVQAKYEFLGIKDFCLGMGRCVGVVIVLLFPQVRIGYLLVMMLLTLTQYLMVFLCSREVRLLNQEEALNEHRE